MVDKGPASNKGITASPSDASQETPTPIKAPATTQSVGRGDDKLSALEELDDLPTLAQPVLDPSMDLQPRVASEFRFPCKVCGSFLYARTNEIGKNTRCPDCFSEFSIPTPPKAAPKPTGPTLLDAPDVALVPVAPKKPAANAMGRSTAEEYLARAAEELDNTEEDLKSVSHDFDTSGWIKNVFSFLGDPSLIVIALVCGAMIGGVLILASNVDAMLASKSEAAGSFGGVLVMILLGTPLLIGQLGNGVAILEMSANQLKRVTRWPMFNPSEMMAELFMVAAAFAFAALPGGILGWLVTSLLGLDQAIALGLSLLSAGLLFPVFLLGMLDNQSIGQPISAEVLQSMPTRSDAWAAMYLLTGIAILGIFIGWLSVRSGSSTGMMIYGLMLPFMIYFIFHQIGVLASRISFAVNEEDSEEDQENDKIIKET